MGDVEECEKEISACLDEQLWFGFWGTRSDERLKVSDEVACQKYWSDAVKAGFRKVKMGPNESHQFGMGRSEWTQSSPVGKDGMKVTDKRPSSRQ